MKQLAFDFEESAPAEFLAVPAEAVPSPDDAARSAARPQAPAGGGIGEPPPSGWPTDRAAYGPRVELPFERWHPPAPPRSVPGRLTDEQQAALNTRGVSIALSAGAGCGKTFVLSHRFLKELERGRRHAPRLSGLVAITFTDKAATEMRDRIRQLCHARLCECPDDEVDYWTQVVRGLDAARISTFHTFCASLLRTYAVEAGVDPQFGLLNEQIAGVLRKRALWTALQRMLESGDASSRRVVAEFGLSTAVEKLLPLLEDPAALVDAPWVAMTPDDLVAHWGREFSARQRGEIADWLANDRHIRALLAWLAEHRPLSAAADRHYALLRSKILATIGGEAAASHPSELASLCYVKGITRAEDWSSQEVYRQLSRLLEAARQFLRSRLDADTPFDAARERKAAELGLAAWRVGRAAAAEYAAQKRALGKLDFDDLLVRTRDLLEQEPVRQRAAEGIQFLMVDEFQDTDPIQAQIVRRLLAPNLANGRLFLVGDAQQSIYGFRRADPRVFEQLRHEIPAQGRLPLRVNFRSQPAILDFVNAVFAANSEEYEPLRPVDDRQLSPPPCIEFLLAAPEPLEDGQDGSEGGQEARRETADDARRREARWLARRIAQLTRDGCPRVREKGSAGTVELRPVQPGDVVVLFRTLNNVRFYEAALRDVGLDYYLVGGRAYYAQQEVYDLANLLRAVHDPWDDVSLLGVLRSPMFGLSDDALLRLAVHGGSLSGAMSGDLLPDELDPEQRERVQRARTTLAELRALKDRVSLPRLLHEALERTAGDASLLLEFLGERKLANLFKLCEEAWTFERSGTTTFHDFVEQLQTAILDQANEEDAVLQPAEGNVVRLMTVHKAKGLEFPVVCVADILKTDHPGRTVVRCDAELGPLVIPEKRFEEKRHVTRAEKLVRWRMEREAAAEEARLLYVALTRAADHLILSGTFPAASKKQSKKSTWFDLLSRAVDLETGAAARDPTTGREAIPDDFLARLPRILVHKREPAAAAVAAVTWGDERVGPRGLLACWSEAVPARLPEMLRPVPVTARRPTFTVSELERIDARLRGKAAPEETAQAPGFPDNADDAVLPPDFPIQIGNGFEEGAPARPAAEQLGSLVHAAIERLLVQIQALPDAAPREAAELARWAVELSASDEPPDLRQEAARLIAALLESPLWAELLAAPQRQCELDFLLRCELDDRSVAVSGTIDCLVLRADGSWALLDWKTGGRTRSADELRDEYEFQLGVYGMALEQALGEPPREAALVMLSRGGEMIRVPMGDAARQRIRARLHEVLRAADAWPAESEQESGDARP